MKTTLKKAIAITVATALGVSALNLTVFAASSENLQGLESLESLESSPANASKLTSVVYVDENGKVLPENADKSERAGIKSVTIDGVNYYDINGGKYDPKTGASKENLYMQAITSPSPDGLSPLDYWSQLAYLILRDNRKYTTYGKGEDSNSDFDKYLGKTGQEAWCPDLLKCMTSTTSGGGGTIGGDCYAYTGLTYTNSLADVRMKMANEIARLINNKKIDGQRILDETNNGKALPYLKDHQGSQGVLYSIVTTVNQEGKTPKRNYNSYGIAFYDFSLEVVNDPNLELVTAVDAYGSFEEGAQADPQNITYSETSSTDPRLDWFTNSSEKDAVTNSGKTSVTSNCVTNTVSNSSTYTFGQTMSAKSTWGLPTNLWGGEIAFSASAEEMYAQEDSIAVTVDTNIEDQNSVAVDLEPHTARAVRLCESTTAETTTYQCPVKLNYKVAIFSLSGGVYANSSIRDFGKYDQQYFCATFGDKTGNAKDDLVLRLVTNKNVTGYEESIGATYGWKESQGSVNKLNWDSFLGQTPYSGSYSKAKKTGTEITNWLMTNVPMSAFGASVSGTVATHKYEIMPAIALYPLKEVGYTDTTSQVKEYSTTPGTPIVINNKDLHLYGNDGDLHGNVPYCGFNPALGTWVLSDQNGNELQSSEVADVSYNKSTGQITITPKTCGDVWLTYKIDENVYQSYEQQSGNYYTSNSELDKTAQIHVTVSHNVATVEATGTITGTVGDVIDLNNCGITLKARDASGFEVPIEPANVQWKAYDLNGVAIDQNNQMTLNQAGTYQICAIYQGVQSNPVTVTVTEPVPDDITISTIDISITAPQTGEIPSTIATPNTAGYHCGEVVWTPGDNPFQSGKCYTANITFYPEPGYVFADDLTVTVDGAPATILHGNSTNEAIEIIYTFAPTV